MLVPDSIRGVINRTALDMMQSQILLLTLTIAAPILHGCTYAFDNKERQCAEAAIALATATKEVNVEFEKGDTKNKSTYSAWKHAYYESLKWHDRVCQK